MNKIKSKFFLSLMLVLLPAVVAALPLFGQRFIPTHDGEYHIIRFYEFEKMLRAGYFFPRWAPGLNSGYGVPLFTFFYPLPNYFGALFHSLGWSYPDALKATLAFGYLSSIVFCFLWLRKLFNEFAATIGAIIFSFTPYWFVDIYIRGSVGEVLAILFFFIALVTIEYKRYTYLSFAVAFIILGHNILSMIFVPFVLVYSFAKSRVWPWIGGLGIGLSAYFWLPALAEREFVTGLNSAAYRDHFPLLAQLLIPSWGTGLSGSGYELAEMSYQIGVVPLLVFFIGLVFFLRERDTAHKKLIFRVLFIVSCAIFLMLGSSNIVWEVVTPLQLLQYPWRLLSVLLPSVAIVGAYVATRIHKLFAIGLVLFAIVFALGYSRPVTYEPRGDTYYLFRPNFIDGTSSLGNSFGSIWSPWKETRPLHRLEILIGDIAITSRKEAFLDYQYEIDVADTGEVRLNILYYPGWEAYVDNIQQEINYQLDGTIRLKVPKGRHVVEMRFKETPIRILANIVSVSCFFWLVGSSILKQIYASSYRHISVSRRS